MNTTQVTSTFASLIAFVAGLAAGRGLFGWDQATWITILTAAVGFGATVWNAVSGRTSALVTNVANMPQVKEIKLDASAPGTAAINAATPNNVTTN